MAKKRRTRAQKQRAATRRHFPIIQPAPLLTPPINSEKIGTNKIGITSKDAVLLRPRDLRISLWLLGSLLGLQVLLWWLFRVTQIDEALYNWIKL